MALPAVAGRANACLTSTTALLIDQDPISQPSNEFTILLNKSWAAASNWCWQDPRLRTGQPAEARAEVQGILEERLVLGY